jgi:hypothetical protein
MGGSRYAWLRHCGRRNSRAGIPLLRRAYPAEESAFETPPSDQRSTARLFPAIEIEAQPTARIVLMDDVVTEASTNLAPARRGREASPNVGGSERFGSAFVMAGAASARSHALGR